jgi:hypothetical protein
MGMSQDQERFDEYLQRVARELDPPPAVPREEMWARIDAVRRPLRARAAAGGRVISLARWLRPARLVRWAPALAAMLVLGVAIGRLTVRQEQPVGAADGRGASVATAAEAAAVADSTEQLPYRLAATEHLVRTEALLTALPTDAQQGRGARVADWASGLLTDTRLLMDSPAGRDQELKQLLQDLELVLAQIAALPGDVPQAEVQMIQDGIERRYVLLRLRAATSKRSTAAS